ncbi:MAG: hypothetical protein HYV03_06880 [Deltaproteobacteria bacterium]|nr:hypothetical protein [Deltaproteobacteria bacterium]
MDRYRGVMMLCFSMRVTPGRLWYLYFLDRAKKGKQMFLGRLSSSKLDAIVPQKSSATGDFGTVTIDSATGTASSSKEHSEIISSLGIDSGTADTVGAIDDAVRRYSNPDIDEDGTIDCKESKKYMLDFHVRFDMKVSGTRATISDIIDNFLSESATTATYTNTGVYVAYPTSFSSATTGSVTFKDSAVTTDEGGAIPANTATSAVTTNNFSGYYGFGPNISAGSELPSGDIVFSFGGKTLTFADVKTPALSELTAPTGRIFPFIKFTKSDAACTNLCTIAGVGYQWMKKTASGWTAASATEIEVLVASAGGNISLRIDNDSSKSVQITIPKTSVSGTITWTAANATLSGLTSAEFTAITTDRLCHLGLSYDDQIGMRHFEGIDNASGTCS